MQISALLGLHEAQHQHLRADDPSQPQARGHNLGKGPQVGSALRDEGADRRDVLALVPQLAVGVVLDDREVQFRSDLCQLLAALQGHRRTGRVVEVGQNVDKLGRLAEVGEHLFVGMLHLIHDHAILIEAHSVEARLISIPSLDRSQVGGTAGEHEVTGVNENLANQVQGLLGAIGQQDVAGHGRDAILVHCGGQVFLERSIPLSGAVLQCLGAVLVDDVTAGFLDLAQREEVRGRQTTGEGDDVRLLGQFEQFADSGTLHAFRARGQVRRPIQHWYVAVQIKIQFHRSPPDLRFMVGSRNK